MYEEGGDSHGYIYDSESDEVNSYGEGDDIGVFTSASNVDNLDISNDENSNGGSDRSDDDDGKNNTNQSDNYE